MIGIAEAFSARYAEARKKFLEAAATAGLRTESFVHPLLGIDGETLAADVARDGPADAQKMLLLTSASHGVDGDCGSGVQVFALHDQEWRDKARDAGVAVLYVHALDPYGFSHPQRSTHDSFSQQTFRTVLRQHAAHAHQLAWIDVHTGPGPSGIATRICVGVKNDPAALARAHAWWDGAGVTPVSSGPDGWALLHGELLQSVRAECPGVLTTALALEMGNDTQTDAWQGLVISQARQALFQAVEGLNS